MENTQPRITRNEITKKLFVAYTLEDREGLIEDMLEALRREEELKQERRDLNRRIHGHVEARNNASEQLDKGGEEKEVACQQVWNFEAEEVLVEALGVTVGANSVTVIRLDTKEVVGESRAIKEEERQQSFLGKEPEPAQEQAQEGGDDPRCIDPMRRAVYCLPCEDTNCQGCCAGCAHQGDIPEGVDEWTKPVECREPVQSDGEAQGQEEAA